MHLTLPPIESEDSRNKRSLLFNRLIAYVDAIRQEGSTNRKIQYNE